MAVKPIVDTVSMLRDALSSGHGAKYKRLAEAMELRILDGSIEGGAKLPPHRSLADRLGVTIGTVSRAYAELERMGLVVARVGDGTFVRQRDLERKRDIGFSNFVEERPEQFDMSRNMHIPGAETSLPAQSLLELARNPQTLAEMTLYTPDAGLPRYRQAGARWLAHGDFRPQAEQVLCVNGGQHGLLCTLMALLRAGDTLVTEQLTYPGLISAARILGIKLLGAAMDEEGLIPAALDELCRQHRISALYCTPTLQNPTTGVLSVARREALVAVCREHNLLIIEIGRRKQLVEGLLEGLSYRTHPQCPHFWIEVPEPWRASDVEAELKLKNYLVATAEAFAVGRAAVPQFVRASVSNASHDDALLLQGFQALSNSLRQGSDLFAE